MATALHHYQGLNSVRHWLVHAEVDDGTPPSIRSGVSADRNVDVSDVATVIR